MNNKELIGGWEEDFENKWLGEFDLDDVIYEVKKLLHKQHLHTLEMVKLEPVEDLSGMYPSDKERLRGYNQAVSELEELKEKLKEKP